MTKDEALTMILASIAMEELSLSHILNAESEKLHDILDALPERPEARTQEILTVNRSVTELLDTVMQNQLLLKGKLEKVLDAVGRTPVPALSRPSADHPFASPYSDEEPQKSAIRLINRYRGFSWRNGVPLSWKCQGQRGRGIQWNEDTPAQIELDPKKTYALDYTINLHGPYPGANAGTVFIRLTPCDAFSGILPTCFSVRRLEREPLTLHYSTILFPQTYPASRASLSLLLDYRDHLLVNQASLSIVEL